jgi:hypothetical protein
MINGGFGEERDVRGGNESEQEMVMGQVLFASEQRHACSINDQAPFTTILDWIGPLWKKNALRGKLVFSRSCGECFCQKRDGNNSYL